MLITIGRGVSKKIVANCGTFIDDDMGRQDGVTTKFDVFANGNKRPDRRAFPDGGGRRDSSHGMDAGCGGGRLIEKRERSGEIVIRIL